MVTLRRPLLICVALAVLLGAAPLWPWLAPPLKLFLPLAGAYGVWCELSGRPPLPARLATGATVAGFLWFALQFSRADIVTPAVGLLAFLLGMRLITEKSGRNLLQLFALALLCLAASSLYSLSGAFLFFLGAEVLCVACGLVLLCFADAEPHTALPPAAFRRLLGVGLGIPLASLLLIPPLFLILPRTQTPLWNFLNRQEAALSGLTERIEPGSVSALAADRRVALRVECASLPPQERYWRAIVLNAPEGRAWVRRPPPTEERTVPQGGRAFPQVLYIEPRPDRFIPALDRLYMLAGVGADQTGDGLAIARRPLEQRRLVQAVSRLGGSLRATRPFDTGFYLALPDQLSPRLRSAGADLAAAGGPRQRIAAAEALFVRQGLTYSLTRLPTGDDPLDDFLFTARSGYCEHFATTFATLLRLAGVPTRLVGGYHGGEYNALGGYYVVTEEKAHVWVEALVEGEWLRIDPTRLALNAATIGSEAAPRFLGWRRWFDAASYYWNRAVITYDLERQIEWLRSGREKGREWRAEFDLKSWGLRLGVALGVGVMLWLLVRHGRRSREESLVRDFLRRLHREGIATDRPDLGLRDLAARSAYPAAREFVARYHAIVFGGRRVTRQEATELKALLRRMES